MSCGFGQPGQWRCMTIPDNVPTQGSGSFTAATEAIEQLDAVPNKRRRERTSEHQAAPVEVSRG